MMDLSGSMSFLFFVGRFLLAGYFLYMAFNSIRNWQSNVEAMKKCNVPLPTIGLLCGLLVQVLASVLLIVGQFLYFATLILMLFLLTYNFACNRFWKKEGELRKVSRQLFITNFALIGALILILVII